MHAATTTLQGERAFLDTHSLTPSSREQFRVRSLIVLLVLGGLLTYLSSQLGRMSGLVCGP
jgi:hypothetical protein